MKQKRASTDARTTAKPVKSLSQLSKYDAIEIVWLDSSEVYGWQDQDLRQSVDDLTVATITNYLDHDDIILNTVRCISASQHGGLLSIPLCAIQSIKKLS